MPSTFFWTQVAIVICVLGVAAFVTIAAFFAESHPITATQLVTVLIILVVVLAILLCRRSLWLRGIWASSCRKLQKPEQFATLL